MSPRRNLEGIEFSFATGREMTANRLAKRYWGRHKGRNLDIVDVPTCTDGTITIGCMQKTYAYFLPLVNR